MKNNLNQSQFLWNMVAGLFNAGHTVVLLIVVSRSVGLEDAGILTIAFAIGHLLMTIGKYSVRAYQVTDVESKIEFNNYFSNRLITTGIMIFISVGYVIFSILSNNYSMKKGLVVFFISLIYGVESIEDVFLGQYQKNGRLDIAGKIYIFRWSMTLVGISIVLFIWHNLLCGVVVGYFISLFLSLLLVWLTYTGPKIFLKFDLATKKIFLDCFPLFIVGYLSFYVSNAPKYAIDGVLSDEIQACFSFISMPVFFIELLSAFIYQPQMVLMSNFWNKRDIIGFNKIISFQILSIILICFICIIGAYLIGIPILSFIFHVDLHNYLVPLLILLAGGGFLAIVMYFCVVLTILKLQKITMFLYGGIALLTFVISSHIVNQYGVVGISLFFTLSMIILSIGLLGVYKRCVKSI